MRSFFIFIVSCLLISCNSNGKRTIIGDSPFQKKMNSDFKDASKSPLTKTDLKKFKGLAFFPIDNKFKVTAQLTKTPNSPVIPFQTTTERIVAYKKYGVVSFNIDSKNFSLNIYKDEAPEPIYKDYLFLPFLDKTNGKSTYKGGRYVEILTTDENKEGTQITIDFNKAYNPYCAYNKEYSCPITPSENYLDMPIEAGVKAFEKP